MILNQIILLSILSAIGVISATLCAPALPFIADHFSVHFSEVQFTISLFLVGNAFGQFLSGPLSDQLGQKMVLLGGLLLYVTASFGCALSDQMSVLLAARFFQGMASAVGPVLARAITASSFPPGKSAQVQSYATIGVGVASILAIFCSGYLSLISWRWSFGLATGLGIFLLFWAFLALKNVPGVQKQEISFRKIFFEMWKVLKHPPYLANALILSITYGLMYGYIALFPFLLIEIFHEKNPAQVGIYSAYMIAFYMIGAFLSSRLVLRWKSIPMVGIGILLQLLSGAFLLFPAPLALFLSALFLFNVSIGIIMPMTIASALAPFAGQAVGAASSGLGFSYRLIGSLLSYLICQFSLAGGRNLGRAIFLLSLGSVALFIKILLPQMRRRSDIRPQSLID